jgi:hypothetical protein
MDSMEQIISSMGIRLGDKVKLKLFSRSWRVEGSKLIENKFIIVLELEGGEE